MRKAIRQTGSTVPGSWFSCHALALAAWLLTCLVSLAADPPRERLLLDFGWKFRLGDDWATGERLDKAGQSRGPASRNFSDASWRAVDLPHDWVVELPFDATADGSHGYKAVGPGFQKLGWAVQSCDWPASWPLTYTQPSSSIMPKVSRTAGAANSCGVAVK